MSQEWRLFFDMQQTVRLLNDLGERYGSEHKYFDLRSPAEAIKLLCINQPEFAKELAEAHDHGVGYTLVQAGELLGYDDLRLPLGSKDLILTPVVAGSGGGTGKILIGAALIAVAILAPGVGLVGASFAVVPGAAGAAAAIAAAAGTIGIGLALTGVAQLLSPQPVIPSLNNQDRTRPGENTGASGPQGVSRATSGQQSYAFSGPANTVGVGATVPLVYGELLIGSHLLSSKLEITEESDPSSDYFSISGNTSITINGEKVSNKFESLNGLRTRKWNNIKGVRSDQRIKPNDVISIVEGEDIKVEAVDNKEPDNDASQNLQIFLEINKGFYNEIGGKFVPAFVTYEITVGKNDSRLDGVIFARVRATVQGLLKPSQNYKLCHAVSYGEGEGEDDNTEVFINLRIIDTDAEPNQQIVVRALGYNFFSKKSENRTEDLVEI